MRDAYRECQPYYPSREVKLERLQLPVQGSALVRQRRVHFASYRYLLLTRFLCHHSSFARNRRDGRPNEQYLLSLNKGRPEQNLAYPRQNWFTCCTSAVQLRIQVSKVGFLVYQAIRPLWARSNCCTPADYMAQLERNYPTSSSFRIHDGSENRAVNLS